ncbi:MAG: HAD hydrolase-like protein [Clostridiaceae bacterium]|nr:HAD hydrolase-like protein [Clostridiaceae bacterium]
MKYTHVLWDFNGTLYDDVDVAVYCENVVLARRGLPLLQNADAYRAIFGFPVRDYYVRAGLTFARETFEAVGQEWYALYTAHMQNASVRDGVPAAIRAFADAGIVQTVLSASQIDTLRVQLGFLSLADTFDEILALGGIHADSKEHLALDWRGRHPDASAVLIGDTVHDADVARAALLDCILVEGGHQCADALIPCGFPVVRDIPAAAEMILKG